MKNDWLQVVANIVFIIGLFAHTMYSSKLSKRIGRISKWIRGKDYRNVCIYVYDDNEYDLDLIERNVLSRFENHHELFNEQEAFLKKAEVGRNIFIIDHFSPGMSGLEMAQKIKRANPSNWAIAYSGTQNIQILLDYTNQQDRVDKFVSKHGEDRYINLENAITQGIIIISNQ